MCSYNITLEDKLVERVRPAFANSEALCSWMQEQLEVLVLQLATRMTPRTPVQGLSKRLRGIAHAPESFDYKKELANRY